MSLPRIWLLTVERPIARFDATAKHLDELGIHWDRFDGFDNQRTRLLPVDTFDFDRVGEKIGPKHIAATLSHMAIWYVMRYQPDDHFIVMEYDVRVQPNFAEQYAEVIENLPADWQVCFLGSCCTQGREHKHVKGNIYEVPMVLCGHCIMYHESALPILIRAHQNIHQPLDIAMVTQSLPLLKSYVVLPRIVEQHGTPLPP